MTDLDRRETLKLLSLAPLLAMGLPAHAAEAASEHAARALGVAAVSTYAPKFFTAAEFRTVRILSDLVIPRDDRSGGATDAGVPEFMDFIMTEYPSSQKWMREGLAWLDTESQRRAKKSFVSSTNAQRTAILDDIAFPRTVAAELKDGAAFFSRFRDLTSSGFWSSRIGVRDLQYIGNRPIAAWNGCSPAALRRLGVSYKKG